MARAVLLDSGGIAPVQPGALIYHSRELIPEWVRSSRALPAAILLLWAVNLIAAPDAFGSVFGAGRFYWNLALVTAFVSIMCLHPPSGTRGSALDARLGDLSYPVYLLHMQIGVALVALGIVPRFEGRRSSASRSHFRRSCYSPGRCCGSSTTRSSACAIR